MPFSSYKSKLANVLDSLGIKKGSCMYTASKNSRDVYINACYMESGRNMCTSIYSIWKERSYVQNKR